MPKVTGGRKRGEYVALEIMKIGKAVTPSEINAHVGRGDYASKYMSFLKRDGFGITVNKDGREVVSYTLTSIVPEDKRPAGAFDRPVAAKTKTAAKPKAKKAAAKAKPKAKAKTKKVVVPAVDTTLPAKKVVSQKAAAKKAPKPVEEKAVFDSGEIAGGSFAVDNDFDNFEVDVSDLA